MSYPVGRLSNVASAWPSNVDKHSVDGESPVRLCNYTDVYKNATISSALNFMAATAKPEQIDRFRIRRGDTLITKDSETADDIGIPAFVEYEADDLVCGYHLAIVRPVPELVDPRFLYWVLSSQFVLEQWAVKAAGVTRVGIRSSDLNRVDIPIPPLEEQRAIADYLDRETAQIDRVVSEHERLIALARERYVASVDLDVDSESPNWVPLRRVAQVIDCAHVTAEVTADSRFPVAGLNEVGGVELNLETSRMTTREYFDLLREGDREPRAGDLVFVRNVSVGRAAVVPSGLPNFALGQDCVLIRPGKAIDSNYMRLALETSKVKAAIEVASKGSTFKRINVAQIRDIPLPLTSIQAQQQVVMKLTSRFNRFRELEAKKLAFVEILAERRAALITAAVTGQIDVSQGRAA